MVFCCNRYRTATPGVHSISGKHLRRFRLEPQDCDRHHLESRRCSLTVDGSQQVEQLGAKVQAVEDHWRMGRQSKGMIPPNNKPKRLMFPLGRIVATLGALEALSRAKENGACYLMRHVTGDWGEVDREDWAANDQAVKDGLRILSAYTTRQGDRIWLISEADRSSTCILLPSEY